MKQSTALQILKTGQNVFLTGQAGAGKTYVLNQYIHYLRVRNIAVAITASTGIAATHMNGMTIHAWSGMGIKDSFNKDDYARLKRRQSVLERIKDTKALIIDEISMLHAKQVDLLNEILQTLRENEQIFGGMQVVFSGDFFQLPPVGNKGENNKEKFAFMAKAWAAANFQICYLDEQHRQVCSDESSKFGITLNDILNQIRAQDVTQSAIETLLATKTHNIDLTRTRLYTHNASVDKINEEELDALSSKAHIFECTTYGEAALIDTLKKNVRATDTLTLKIGAKVMFVKNIANLDVFNGTIGEVIDFAPLPQANLGDNKTHSNKTAYPIVRLNTGRQVFAEPEEWVIEDNHGEVLASYSQVPLCLAWAITIHKSQGMTLEAAEIDLSHTFETGQGYVALSRLRSLNGLKLLGLNKNSLLLDEWVFRIDQRLKELANQHETHFSNLDKDTIKELHHKFILSCGGITDQQSILRNEKAHRTYHNPKTDDKPNKGQSLENTKTLVQQGLTIDEIAATRHLAKSTIIGHIGELIKQDGKDSYQQLMPDSHIIKAIQTAYQTLQEQGEFTEKITLRPIVELLNKQYDYNTVRLALAFIDTQDTNQDNETKP